MNSFQEVFSSVKQYCREQGIPDVAVNLWINALTPVQLDGSTAVFTVQSSFQRAVVLGNYEALLKEAFFNILGFDVPVVVKAAYAFKYFDLALTYKQGTCNVMKGVPYMKSGRTRDLQVSIFVPIFR